MYPSFTARNDVLRDLLHQSLQYSLANAALDAQRENAQRENAQASWPALAAPDQGLLLSNYRATGSTSFAGSSFPPIPAYFQCSMLDSAPQPGLLQEPGKGSHHLYAHARAEFLKQQLIEVESKRRYQESYLSVIRDNPSFGLKAAIQSHPMALNSLLVTPGQKAAKLSQGNIPVAHASFPESQEKVEQTPPPHALEALGCSLRKKDDPYIDVSALQDPDPKDSFVRRTRGGVSTPFPEKLHQILVDVEKERKTAIISFFSHGRAFAVHDMDQFVSEIMPRYFKHSKWNSFARQLNLYGFIRITHGPDAGGYYHELFLKGRQNLCFHMRRVGVPQGEDRRKLKMKHEAPDPDFYSMKPLTARDDNINSSVAS